MESYTFCTIINLAILAAISWLGYLVEKGTNMFLIFVMVVLAFGMILPARDIFTCQKCGWSGEVKTFTSSMPFSSSAVCNEKERGNH